MRVLARMLRQPMSGRIAPQLSSMRRTTASYAPLDTFPRRHIGPTSEDEAAMLSAIGLTSLEELVSKAIPQNIIMTEKRNLAPALSEFLLSPAHAHLLSGYTSGS